MIGRIPVGSRISMGSDHEGHTSDETPSFDDMVFRFIEGGGSFDSVRSGGSSAYEFDDEEETNENLVDHFNKKKAYWESQHQLVQTTLYKTSSIESKIRQATKEALRDSKLKGITCSCRRLANTGCRNCVLTDISDRLRRAGFDSAVCKSKWRSSEDILSGEHTYIDVVHKSSTNKMEVRVVIELKFRAEFEMARASDEYNALIERLPELYVGKAERLRSLINILCAAAKKGMKEKNMHMGPWRKQKYMQAKWLGSHERVMSKTGESKSLPSLQRLVKPKTSMLTFDFLDMMSSSLHQLTALEELEPSSETSLEGGWKDYQEEIGRLQTLPLS